MKHETTKKGRRPINERAFEKIREAGRREVIIKRKEWKLATPPGAYLLRQRIGLEYVVMSLADGSGWVISSV